MFPQVQIPHCPIQVTKPYSDLLLLYLVGNLKIKRFPVFFISCCLSTKFLEWGKARPQWDRRIHCVNKWEFVAVSKLVWWSKAFTSRDKWSVWWSLIWRSLSFIAGVEKEWRPGEGFDSPWAETFGDSTCVDSGEGGNDSFQVFCQLLWVGTCFRSAKNNSSVPGKPAVLYAHLEGGLYPLQH